MPIEDVFIIIILISADVPKFWMGLKFLIGVYVAIYVSVYIFKELFNHVD